jgi:hypothetical protein
MSQQSLLDFAPHLPGPSDISAWTEVEWMDTSEVYTDIADMGLTGYVGFEYFDYDYLYDAATAYGDATLVANYDGWAFGLKMTMEYYLFGASNGAGYEGWAVCIGYFCGGAW